MDELNIAIPFLWIFLTPKIYKYPNMVGLLADLVNPICRYDESDSDSEEEVAEAEWW
jgi:hypothetical protein